MSNPSSTAKALKALRTQANVRLVDVASRAGLSLSGYQHYEDRFKDKYLPPKLAPVLIDLFEPAGIPRDKVLALFQPLTVHSPQSPETEVGTETRVGRQEFAGKVIIPERPPGKRDLPVHGSARCGPDGRFEWNGQVIDWRERSPALDGVAEAYGVYVVGSSMEPRYYDGELVQVHPGRRVTPDCFVVVQFYPKAPGEPAEALIKQFVKETPTKLVLREFCPEARLLEYPRETLHKMHRIIWSGEG